MKFDNASVKVMRSYDYCHFEICIGSSEAKTPADVDELRKTAARLADKAVEQYKIAKVNAQKLLSKKQQREFLIRRMDVIRKKEEGSRTVREQAELKAFEDEQWHASRRYDYDDDWHDDDQDF